MRKMQTKTAGTKKEKGQRKEMEKSQAEIIITPSKQVIINMLEAEKSSLKKQMQEIENYLTELKKYNIKL